MAVLSNEHAAVLDSTDERVALYSAVDDVVTHYVVNVADATLTRRASTQMLAKVQYAWFHPSRRALLVSTSNGGPRVPSDRNHVAAWALAADGALSQAGVAEPLGRRAVHMCVDPDGQFALNAHNFPFSGITVHHLAHDGSVGEEIQQSGSLDFGIYPHQVMVFPSGRTVLIVDRGNKAQDGRAEQPGALRTFAFNDGVLSSDQVVAPNGGFGFGPRHVSFHPNKPWLYVSDERTNRLYMFRLEGDRIQPEPAFACATLRDAGQVSPRQIAGPVHVDPLGRCVYVANRADHSVEDNGIKVFTEGENNIAVFAIDPVTGEPSLLQHAETKSFHVRTFACDPSGRMLVTASIKALARREHDGARPVPAALSVFRIGSRGRLEFVRKYDVDTTGSQLQYWMGMVGLE